MKSEYEYKVVRSNALGLNYGLKRKFDEIWQAQIDDMAEQGWDFYKSIDQLALVFRRKRVQ